MVLLGVIVGDVRILVLSSLISLGVRALPSNIVIDLTSLDEVEDIDSRKGKPDRRRLIFDLTVDIDHCAIYSNILS